MKEKGLNPIFGHRCRRGFSICLAVFLFSVAAASASNQDVFESSAPILISEADSTRALAINPDNWKVDLPRENSGVFPPGSRVMVFLANIDLLPGEGANAFRVFAADASGEKYRFTVESLQRIRAQDRIYGLTVRIHDANGYNGQPRPEGEVAIWVSWRGNASNRVRLRLGKLGRIVRDEPGAVPTPASLKLHTTPEIQSTGGDRKRFMEQAAFGPSSALDFRLRQIGIRRWIDEEFNKPYPTFPYPNYPEIFRCEADPTTPEGDLCYRNHFSPYHNQTWLVQEALYGDDQLRRRVSWALHQIWVVSHPVIGSQRGMQEYIEILDRNALGNYRDLMYEMTLSPAMGEYLDMTRSTRQNPNENYPRELLQLFSTGLYMVNQDGTLILDNQGNRIPTYDQDKIDQFTKVFTGWILCNNGTNPACPNAVVGARNFIDPMLVSPNEHDPAAKALFDYPGAPNSTIPACGNCTNDAARRAFAYDSLNKTLDNIFYHPNVAPFVGKLFIQHLVTGDPSPAYVARVAKAFNNNGTGVRGDMKAVIKTILLDPEARGSRKTDPTYGKLREPLQYITNFLRTFNVRAGIQVGGVTTTPPASCQNRSDGVLLFVTYDMGQDMWSPPTVFSYFPPDYVVPGTDILGPEFALANTGTSFARNNRILELSVNSIAFQQPTTANPYPFVPCGTSIDLSEATAWATADSTGNSLIEGLNTKMMHGTMSEAMKSKIRPAINFNVPAESKAKRAIFLVASSSQYQIQR